MSLAWRKRVGKEIITYGFGGKECRNVIKKKTKMLLWKNENGGIKKMIFGKPEFQWNKELRKERKV